MRTRLIKIALIGIIIILCFSSCDLNLTYDDGYSDGYYTGYEEGWSAGNDSGMEHSQIMLAQQLQDEYSDFTHSSITIDGKRYQSPEDAFGILGGYEGGEELTETELKDAIKVVLKYYDYIDNLIINLEDVDIY